MGKLFLLTSFFVITPVLILFSILFYSFLTLKQHPLGLFSFSSQPSRLVSYAALPTIQNITVDEIGKKDARVELVKQFFAKYKSPLEPFAQNIVSSADSHGLDFRLVPAMAMQESNLCSKMPENSFNCWGFGIYGKTVTRFGSYSEAIETVTKTLAKDYKEKGLQTPEQIMTRYTPSSNGSWARSVSHFMDKLQ